MAVRNISTQYELDWDITQTSQNIGANTSSVYGRLIIRKKSGSGYWTNNSNSWSVNINGQKFSGSFTYDFRNYDTLTLWSGTVTITHNSDGTKSINSTGYASMSSPSGSATISRSLTLSTIPRASSGSMGSATTGVASTISISRAASSFTHTVKYSFGTFSGTIDTGVGTSVSWTPPHTLFNQTSTRNSATGTGTITIETYSGSTRIGTKSFSFSLTLNSSQKPTLSGASFSEAVTSPVNLASVIGAYVQNQSKLAYSISGAAGIQGSTISKYTFKVGSVTATAQSGTTGFIADSGTVSISVTVTDSRGRVSNAWTSSITVLPWKAPEATVLDVARCRADGTLDPAGTYIKVTLTATISPLTVGGVTKNTLTYKVDTSIAGANVWTSKRNTSAGAVPSVNVSFVVGTYVETESFDVRTQIVDRFKTSTVMRSISVALVALDLGLTTAGIGKFHERGTLDIGGDTYGSGSGNFEGGITAGGGIQVTNWNDATQAGFYWGNNATNQPVHNTATWWSGHVLVHNGYRILQTLYQPNKPGGTVYQRWYSGSSWSSWSPVYAGDDSGWVNISVASGFARQGTDNPQVRKIGNQVYARWGWSSTGISANGAFTVGTIPSGYRPALTTYFRWGTNSAAAVANGVVYSGGNVEVRTPPNATPFAQPGYFLFPSITWLVD